MCSKKFKNTESPLFPYAAQTKGPEACCCTWKTCFPIWSENTHVSRRPLQRESMRRVLPVSSEEKKQTNKLSPCSVAECFLARRSALSCVFVSWFLQVHLSLNLRHPPAPGCQLQLTLQAPAPNTTAGRDALGPMA